jgi:hypothetical protein
MSSFAMEGVLQWSGDPQSLLVEAVVWHSNTQSRRSTSICLAGEYAVRRIRVSERLHDAQCEE